MDGRRRVKRWEWMDGGGRVKGYRDGWMEEGGWKDK